MEDSHMDDSSHKSMQVRGIYARGTVPREEELPEDYGLCHVSKDQVMCRRRMNTPPIDFDETQDCDGMMEDFERAVFVIEHGLVGSVFFNSDLEEHRIDDESTKATDDRIYEERAVLLQSIEHYEIFLEDELMSQYFRQDNFEAFDRQSIARLEKEDEEFVGSRYERHCPELLDILRNPRFGEQIIVSGLQASQICIGDIFEVEAGKSTLRLEVTSPRTVCAWVDKRVASPFGLKGIKRYCNKRGLGGWFARVLTSGELRHGMKLIRTSRPHPKWNLQYISFAMLGEGPTMHLASAWPYWVRDQGELEDLINLKELGNYEWKDEATWMLNHFNQYSSRDERTRDTLSENSTRNIFSVSRLMQHFLQHITSMFRASQTIHRRSNGKIRDRETRGEKVNMSEHDAGK